MLRARSLLRIDNEEELLETFHIKDKNEIDKEKTYYHIDSTTFAFRWDIESILKKNLYPIYFHLVYRNTMEWNPTRWEPVDKRDLEKQYANICAKKVSYEQILFNKKLLEREEEKECNEFEK